MVITLEYRASLMSQDRYISSFRKTTKKDYEKYENHGKDLKGLEMYPIPSPSRKVFFDLATSKLSCLSVLQFYGKYYIACKLLFACINYLNKIFLSLGIVFTHKAFLLEFII